MMRLGAVLATATAVAAVEVTPVEQVTNLLAELQQKVVDEGKEEAKTYDKFACFCKDMSKEKTEAIAAGNAQKGSLNGELSAETKKRNEADKKIEAKTTRLNELATDLDKLESKNKAEKHAYAVDIEDVEAAVDSLERAVKTLKASDKSENALLSVRSTVKTAVLLADSLGINSDAAESFLQQPEVPVSDYDFHSGGIVSILEDLLVSFRTTRETVNSDETKRVQQYTKEKQANHDETKATKKSLTDAQKAKEEARNRIGAIMGDLTLVEANLSDDQNYLLDLTSKCNDKKAAWDQRTAMRMDELTALSQAIGIIRGGVAENTTGQTIRFVQEGESFVQVAKEVIRASRRVSSSRQSRSFMSARSPRDQVLELLRERASELKSASLASLAVQAKGDPLAKVKKLIEELVLRLQEEAKMEESHNGWCVKQTNLAKDKREREAEKVTSLNSMLQGAETKRDKIFETLAKLENEIQELKDTLKETKDIYDEETKQRDNAIKDATAGKDAVESATKVLKEFYEKRAAKPEKSLIQGPKADDIPDAGFEGEYYGSQDTATGIFGMLEVITSDFVRTIEESEKAQKEADKAFFEFEKATTLSLDEKKILHDDYTTQKVETLDKIRTGNTDLDTAMTALESAVTELVELHEACVGGGQTYEERVEKREAEIAALKEAFEILDNYSA